MTWKTSSGIKIKTPSGDRGRILLGNEAILFTFAITCIINSYSAQNDFEKKINVPFKFLSEPQKFTLLEDVANGFLVESNSCPELYALNESAIYFIYQWIIEDFKQGLSKAIGIWGNKIINAYNECFPQLDDTTDCDLIRPSFHTENKSAWIDAIECLLDRILWDRDCVLLENFTPISNSTVDYSTKDYFRSEIVQHRPESKERLYDLCQKILTHPQHITKSNTTDSTCKNHNIISNNEITTSDKGK